MLVTPHHPTSNVYHPPSTIQHLLSIHHLTRRIKKAPPGALLHPCLFFLRSTLILNRSPSLQDLGSFPSYLFFPRSIHDSRFQIHTSMPFHGVKSDCKKGALEAQAFSDSPAGTPSSRMKYRRRLLGWRVISPPFLGNPQEPTMKVTERFRRGRPPSRTRWPRC